MKRSFTVAAFVALFSFLAASLLAQTAAKAAPEIGIKDTKGKTWNLKDLEKDKVYFIEFWATWCGTCKKIDPIVRTFVTENRGKEMEFLSVSIDTDMKKLGDDLKVRKPAYPVLVDKDGTMWKAWNVEAVPAMFMVKNGKIVWSHVGEIKSGDLEKALTTAKSSR